MSSSGQPIVSLRNVDKTFESGTVALNDVNLDVREGEFVSLLGPSGCGKSTVLRIISGLSPATAGSVVWPAGEARLGFVFQEPTLMPWADVAANVRLPIKLGHKQDSGAVANALGRVRLSAFARNYPRELSGGMKMRVSIARALVTKPSLVLADEPTGNLDTHTSLEVMALFQELNDAGTTLLIVTHEQDIAQYARRIVVMRDGRVLRDDRVANRRVARADLAAVATEPEPA